MSNLLSKLNNEQRVVAETIDGPILVLAGAGTGKTTTVVHRVAYLILEKNINPQNVLVLTFTNKAAREMKERGLRLLNDNKYILTSEPCFTTFHSWGLNFIKSMDLKIMKEFGVRDKFTILSESDQVSVLNKCFAKFLSEDDYKVNKAKDFILVLSNIQNIMTPYYDIDNTTDFFYNENNAKGREGQFFDYLKDSIFLQNENIDIFRLVANIFCEYKKIIRSSNSLDFDDLINLPIKILQKHDSIRESLKRYYKYIMIDEFQDTNGSQIELINLILNNEHNICVVGDDSQAIYGWRGARIEYILNFHNFYKDVKKFNLTMNYRSDIDIIVSANMLLSKAEEKHEFKKPLVPNSKNPGIIRTKFFPNADEESKYICNVIKQIQSKTDTPNGEIAILYRSAFINRKIEVELISNGISYKIHNGKALLERSISLKILSYIKFLYNEHSEIALSKVLESASVLTDKRIGEFQIEAERNGETFYEYIRNGEFNIKGLGVKIKEKIKDFNKEIDIYKKFNLNEENSYKNFIEDFFSDNIISNNIDEVIAENMKESIFDRAEKDSIKKATKYTEKNEKLTKALKEKNILDLIKTLMLKYDSLESFLNDAAIEGEVEDKEKSKVNLMTMHASKGLEFDYVFLPGFCQGIIPSSKNLNQEEERRLAFVAITRARKGLFLTGANKYYGSNSENYSLSTYIEESGILNDKV